MKIKDKGNLSHKVSNRIKHLIQKEKYKPGEKLPNETQLADLFGVSRPTIREAVKLLASQNIVEIVVGKGTFVSQNPGISNDPLGLDFVVDKNLTLSLIEARQIIEPSVAKLAAERANQKDIKKLGNLIKTMKDVTNQHNVWVETELEFHRSIAKATQNSVIMRLVPIIQEAILKSFQYAPPSNLDHKEAYLEHTDIYTMIKDKNPQKAFQSMSNHMNNSYKRTLIRHRMQEKK